MPSSSNSDSSFIPKRNPVKLRRGAASKKIYLFTSFSYVFLFATLIAVAAIYFYSQYTERQLNQEIALLNSEIVSFNEADLLLVQEFDQRLQAASGRLNKGVSMVAVMEALEESTIDTVTISSLNINRLLDSKFVLSATIETDSFDSTIFQRDVYNGYQKVESIEVGELQTDTLNIGKEVSPEGGIPAVSFTAEIQVPFSAIPAEVVNSNSLDTAVGDQTPEVLEIDEVNTNQTDI